MQSYEVSFLTIHTLDTFELRVTAVRRSGYFADA